MTKTITALSFDRHGAKFWRRFSSYAFAAGTHLAPITGAELFKAVHAFPLCFVRNDNFFYLAGLLSPAAGNNYFVAPDGRWLGTYVPACFRSYPFTFAEVHGKSCLCVDESSGLISEVDGNPFFDPDGQNSQSVSQVLNFLQTVEQNRMVTQQGVDALAAAGIIVEWPVGMKADGEETTVAGIYRIDEAGLTALSDEAFRVLHRSQALPIAYAQLFSRNNIKIFSQLAALRDKLPPKPTSPAVRAGSDGEFICFE